jgi:hypothetical protein
MILTMSDLDDLRQALNDLEAMPLIDQARAIPGLMKQADRALSLRRGAVFAALAGPGKPMTIVALAAELDIHRSKVDDAIKAYRNSLEGPAPGRK